MPKYTRAYDQPVEALRTGVLCSYQHMYDQMGAAGQPNTAGRVWQLGTSGTLIVPVWNPAPFRSTHAYVFNGTTLAGNWAVAVYDWQGTRLGTTGSVVQAGANQIQMATLAADIPAGMLQIAMGCNNASATFAYPSPSTGFWPQTRFTALGWGHSAVGSSFPPGDPLEADTVLTTTQHPYFGLLKRWPS